MWILLKTFEVWKDVQGFAVPFRLDRANTGRGIIVYVRDDIPSKLLNILYVSSDTECLVIEINLLRQSGSWYVHPTLTKTIFQIIWWISTKLLTEILLAMTNIFA